MPRQTVALWTAQIPTGEKNRSWYGRGVIDKKRSQCVSIEARGFTWLWRYLLCVVDVFSQGTRGLWYISNSDSTTLSYHPISSRVAMSKEGISTYIMCSCVSNLLQGGKSSFGVFKRRRVHRGILHLFNLFSISFFKMEATRFIYLNGQGPYLPMATLTFITLPPGKTSLTILPQESSILVT